MAENTKYIFVTGGVLSSLGKGLASAAIGMLLESRGLTVFPVEVSAACTRLARLHITAERQMTALFILSRSDN